MKKVSLVLALVLALLLSSTAFVFADGLSIVSTYPEDGEKGFQIQNMGVTIYFNKEVASESNQAANTKLFSIVEKETGEAQDVTVLYHPTDTGKVMVLLKGDLKSATEYEFNLQSGFTADDGTTLAEPVTLSFKTRDTSIDNKVSMALMGVMFIAMFVVSKRGVTKTAEEKKAEEKKDTKVNPYKESKKTGKSVEEIVQKDQASKAKAEAKREREARKRAEIEEKLGYNVKYLEEGHYAVKRPRVVVGGAAAHNAEKRAKQAAAEAERAARRAKGTTNPKNKKKKH